MQALKIQKNFFSSSKHNFSTGVLKDEYIIYIYDIIHFPNQMKNP